MGANRLAGALLLLLALPSSNHGVPGHHGVGAGAPAAGTRGHAPATYAGSSAAEQPRGTRACSSLLQLGWFVDKGYGSPKQHRQARQQERRGGLERRRSRCAGPRQRRHPHATAPHTCAEQLAFELPSIPYQRVPAYAACVNPANPYGCAQGGPARCTAARMRTRRPLPGRRR